MLSSSSTRRTRRRRPCKRKEEPPRTTQATLLMLLGRTAGGYGPVGLSCERVRTSEPAAAPASPAAYTSGRSRPASRPVGLRDDRSPRRVQLRAAPTHGRRRPCPHLGLPLPRLPAADRKCVRRAGALPGGERSHRRAVQRVRPHLGRGRGAHVLVLPRAVGS